MNTRRWLFVMSRFINPENKEGWSDTCPLVAHEEVLSAGAVGQINLQLHVSRNPSSFQPQGS
jgi:hypothetical protein